MGKNVTSTFVSESAVINAQLSSIWPLLRLEEFDKFYHGIIKTECLPPTTDSGKNTVRWTFKDYILDVQEEEYSVGLGIVPIIVKAAYI